MHGETRSEDADRRVLEFDASTARLTADVDSFYALAAESDRTDRADRADPLRDPAREPHRDPGVLAAFEEAGLVADGRPHPAVRTGLGTMREPCARLEVEMATPFGAWLHHGWLDLVSTLLVDRGDGTHDFVEVDAEFLPTTLAQLTDLRPRPRLEGPGGRVRDLVLDGLLSADARTRERAAEAAAGAALAWPGVAACLRSGCWTAVGVDVARTVGRSTATSRLVWIDTSAGIVVVDDERDGHLVGASVTDVWRSLVRILPSAARLDALTRTA